MAYKTYNDDCFNVMSKMADSKEKFDAIITDPPYGVSFQSNYRIKKYQKIENDKDLNWLDKWLELAFDLLKPNKGLFIFCSWHNVDIFKQKIQKHFKIKNILIWNKKHGGMGDLEGSFSGTYEMIIYAVKGNLKLNGKRDYDIVYSKRTVNELHPTQKPVDLLVYLIQKITKQGDKVLDPFAGSFSTIVACEQINRKGVGIELNKDYYEIGLKRLKNNQTRLDI